MTATRQPSDESGAFVDRADPDMELVCAIRQGHPEAWNELHQRHRKSLLGYLEYLTGDSHIAEDICQETLLIVYRKLDRFTGPRFKAWLYKIARNEAIAQNKQRNRHRVELDRLAKGQVASWTQVETGLEILDRLPERHKQVLVLRYAKGLTITETAKSMGVSIRTVNRIVAETRDELHKLLDREDLS